MIRVSDVVLTLDAGAHVCGLVPQNDGPLPAAVAGHLGLREDNVVEATLLHRSVDARKKGNVRFVCTCAVRLSDTALETCLLDDGRAMPYAAFEPIDIPVLPTPDADARPLVVGSGPAGLFAAAYLARAGLRPIVVERGPRVDERAAAVDTFERTGVLDPEANVQFGEGGAGLFSDGKLTTGTKSPLAATVLHWFADAGAPNEILWQAKPHIGSDRLPDVVAKMRADMIDAGADVRFGCRLDDLIIEDGRVVAVRLTDIATGAEETSSVGAVVLACGHSARDTFTMLLNRGLAMQRKPFSMGVRIEHLQATIDRAQYGRAAGHPALGPAEYKMAVRTRSRSAYTFCMCPGGRVVAAASEEGGIVTNGISDFARDGVNADAAVLVNVEPDDFGEGDELAGMRLQRSIEQRAYRAALASGGAAYAAPAQRVGDFLVAHGNATTSAAHGTARPEPTYPRGTVGCDLGDVLPAFVCDALAQALPLFDRRLHGFADPAAIMTAPETRSSSPVRLPRDASLQALFRVDSETADGFGDSVRGLYPAGEGPGHAGGIMSAAVDGLRVAMAVAEAYR